MPVHRRNQGSEEKTMSLYGLGVFALVYALAVAVEGVAFAPVRWAR